MGQHVGAASAPPPRLLGCGCTRTVGVTEHGCEDTGEPAERGQVAAPVPGGMFLCMEIGRATSTSTSTDTDRRQLVTIETVTGVRPIPDADAIEVVTVSGWQVVTKIGELGVGERCAFPWGKAR